MTTKRYKQELERKRKWHGPCEQCNWSWKGNEALRFDNKDFCSDECKFKYKMEKEIQEAKELKESQKIAKFCKNNQSHYVQVC